MSTVPAGATSPFAHLSNLARKVAGKKADDQDKDKKDDPKAEDQDEKDPKAEDNDDEKDPKAEDGGDDEQAAAEKDEEKCEDKEEEKKDSKAKSKKAEGDDDSDKKDDDEPAARQARARERGRISAIVNSEPGGANMKAATEFALNTSIPRDQAIAMLRAIGPAQAAMAAPAKVADPLRDRMSSVKTPDVGASDGDRPAANVAEMIILAGKKRRGEV